MMGEKLQILIVDDNPDHRELLELSFAKSGLACEIQTAKSGEECLKILETQKIDFAILDYKLPKMSGMDVLTQIRNHKLEIPTLLMTGEGDEILARNALKLGALDYLPKTAHYFENIPKVVEKSLDEYFDARQEKKFQEELKELEKRYRLTFDSLKGAVIVVDTNLYINYTNRSVRQWCLKFGLDSRIQNRDMFEVFSFIPQTVKEHYHKVIHTGKPHFSMVSYQFLGQEYHFRVQKMPIFKDERVAFIAVVIDDVTREKNKEMKLIGEKEKAEKVNKIRSVLIANISHEIRTPLISINGFADLMEEEPLSLRQKEILQIIKNRSRMLLSLSNDLLDLSKLEARQIVIQDNPLSLSALLNDVCSFGKNLIVQKEKKLTIKVEYGGNIKRHIQGDFFRLKQVLSNLMSHAINFTQEGLIEYGVTLKNADFLEFYVRDSGIGIPDQDKNWILNPFEENYMDSKISYKGYGVGLTISKQLVELMGGELWIDFQDDVKSGGKGSTARSGNAIHFTYPYKPVNQAENFKFS